ncbi:MAG: bifunctional protein-serine/threonine kinase/phosphatase, partial [Steroidobacter sp.]
MNELNISTGHYSDRGRKEINQDFHGVCIPKKPLLNLKGVAVAIADGISTSQVSQIASQSAVKSFFEDYFCTSETWTVKTSAQRVLAAINSWLYSQTQQSQFRFDRDRGFVCTFSAVVIKSTTAHLFHVGDARIYRLRKQTLEQLTEDHRTWTSPEQSYLARALGASPQLDVDYRSMPVERNDVFVLATDGVHEHITPQLMIEIITRHNADLDLAAKQIANHAFEAGSDDNLTVQLMKVDDLPDQEAAEVLQQFSELPPAPPLAPRMQFEGYRIVRELHASHRSHIYLAVDEQTSSTVVIKTPSIDLQHDQAYLERFQMEEWIARRINSAHVLKPVSLNRPRNYIYVVMEYIEGQTLSQWMIDNSRPDIESVRNIVGQVAKGLAAFHRMEMLHQDLRPDNIMIDTTGTVKIIDFGSVRVAGIAEASSIVDENILGTVQYTAPEYFLGEAGSPRSDLFSLAVIAYQMLSGKLPYGAQVAKSRSRSAQLKLIYDSVLDDDREIPAWIDGVLKKAVHPDPYKRYQELSEFVYDLRHPTQEFLNRTTPPLIERNPVRFWKGVSFILLVIII